MKHSRCIPSVLSPWEEDHATAYCRHYRTVTVVSFLGPAISSGANSIIVSLRALHCAVVYHSRTSEEQTGQLCTNRCVLKRTLEACSSVYLPSWWGRRGACVDYSSASSRLGIEMFVPHTGILHCHRLLASIEG